MRPTGGPAKLTMPPIVATFLCLAFIFWAFRRDFREHPNVTGALWLPFFWIFISGSRFISEWLAIFGINLGAVNVEEGSPLDAVFFAIIIGGGIYVLLQRRVSLAAFASRNVWVTIYLAYCLLAVLWSDFPFVAIKRWVKLFGQPVMVLILLTEPDPLEAVTRLLKRCAYILLPVSVLFIKYYPQIGRGFDGWTGTPANYGITLNKNALGSDCFILGLFLLWHILRVWRREKGAARRNELLLCLFLLTLNSWLIHMAQSSTSLAAFLLSAAIVLALSLKLVNPRRINLNLAILIVVGGAGEAIFGLHDYLIHALGRNTTLTGRTDIWHVLLNWDINPIFGAGYESFWLGPRVNKINANFPGLLLNEAHNGYLETYINLGLLGLFFTIAMIIATYFKIRRALVHDFDFGILRLAYLAAFIAYNWTEAAFRTHGFPFFMFFLIAIDYTAGLLQERSFPARPAAPEDLDLNLARDGVSR